MFNLDEEMEKVLKLKDFYIQLKDESIGCVKDYPYLKSDLEMLTRVSNVAIKVCDEFIYSKNFSDYDFLNFETKNGFVTEKLSEINKRLSSHLKSNNGSNFYEGFSMS